MDDCSDDGVAVRPHNSFEGSDTFERELDVLDSAIIRDGHLSSLAVVVGSDIQGLETCQARLHASKAEGSIAAARSYHRASTAGEQGHSRGCHVLALRVAHPT